MDIAQRRPIGKQLARKMGIPSLRSTNIAKAQLDNSGWRNLNEIEKNLLVSVLLPEAVIIHMIKDIVEQFGYKSIVIIYDHTFGKCDLDFYFL